LFFGRVNCRQKKGHQHANDADDNEQFDQRKRTTIAASDLSVHLPTPHAVPPHWPDVILSASQAWGSKGNWCGFACEPHEAIHERTHFVLPKITLARFSPFPATAPTACP